MNRRRKKKDSPFKTVCLILAAAIVMTAAVYVVMSVVGKISKDYEGLDFTTEAETPHIIIDTEEKIKAGWKETDQGWMYYLDEKNFAAGQWKAVEGFLYYFNEDGLMATGEFKQGGQIFTCHDTKGYLKDIQIDQDYRPEDTGEGLDSLVKTNAFWCFLKEEDSGPFKTILYRKTVENKISVLGGDSAPEKTTDHSMRIFGDYVYYLPKVKESRRPDLSEAEKGLCDRLFRMKPGSITKELIAEDVDGYIVLDDAIYYAQMGKIHETDTGTEVATGEARYSVVIRDDSCYLMDGMGNPAVAESGSSISVGDRVYRIGENGKINYVKHGQITIDGRTYYLSGSGTKSSVAVKSGDEDKVLIKENLGVQSYCIVDNQIYYSSYVDKNSKGEWFSQLFRTDLEGKGREAMGAHFPGVIQNMYYYEDEGQIYAEYNPYIWKQAYGVAAVIQKDGSIYRLEDGSVRTGKHVDGNDLLEIVMAEDGKVICLWHDCVWSRSTGITSVLWSKAIELDAGDRSLIDMVEDITSQESSEPQETDPVIQPIEGEQQPVQPPAEPPSQPPTSAETAAPDQSSISHDPVISTEGPHAETQAPVPMPTVPPVSEPSAEVKIVPLGRN